MELKPSRILINCSCKRENK